MTSPTCPPKSTCALPPFCLQVELTGSSAFDYIHPGDHVEMAEQLGMKLPPGRGMSLSQGAVNEDAASSASSSSHPETPEPGGKTGDENVPRAAAVGRKGMNDSVWSLVQMNGDWSKPNWVFYCFVEIPFSPAPSSQGLAQP